MGLGRTSHNLPPDWESPSPDRSSMITNVPNIHNTSNIILPLVGFVDADASVMSSGMTASGASPDPCMTRESSQRLSLLIESHIDINYAVVNPIGL